MDPSPANFFMHVPRPSPNVVEYLYSLCAWADERHRKASECLHQAGLQTLYDLLSKIAGVQVDSIVSVELIRLGHAESLDLSVFLVNRTHAVLLTDRWAADVGEIGSRLEASGITGVLVVPIYCDKFHARGYTGRWEQRIAETGHFNPEVSRASLKALKELPVFSDTGMFGHPEIAAFSRHLGEAVAAEQSYETLPFEEWGQESWHGFYRLLLSEFGGNFASRRLEADAGNGSRPSIFSDYEYTRRGLTLTRALCQIFGSREYPELELNDRRLVVVFPAESFTRLLRLRLLMDHKDSVALGLSLANEYFTLAPIGAHALGISHRIEVVSDFRSMRNNGLLDIPVTIHRLTSAAAFLSSQLQAWKYLPDWCNAPQ